MPEAPATPRTLPTSPGTSPDSAAREFARSLPAQYARTHRFMLGVPAQITICPDGDTVIFLRTRGGDDPVSCLWALDCATWQERLIADPQVLLAREDEDLPAHERVRRQRAGQSSAGIVAYAADRDCQLLAFALSGQLWTVRLSDGVLRRLPAAERVVDPRPDPTGRRVAYVSDGTLRVIETGGADVAVASPDGRDVTWGLAEHVAAESMGRQRGFWWAPDGRRLLVERADTSMVERWYITDPSEPAKSPVEFRYPAAGTANAEVSLWIADLDDADRGPYPVGWDNKSHEYLTNAGWDGTGPYAAVQTRDQRELLVLGIDPDDGSTRILAEQRDDAWVTLVPGLPARTSSGVLLTAGDLGDTRRLLADGVPVTPPGLQLEAVQEVDGERVLFTASDAEPTQIHVWAYEPGPALTRLSDEPGVHLGASRGGTTALISGSLDWPGTRVTVSSEGEGAEIATLAEVPELRPRMELLKLGPRELRAALFLPSWHQSGDPPLPVLMDPYGGPAARKTTAELHAACYVSQWFAEQGFAVLVADGRGTPGRGPAWERAIRFDVAGPALADQVGALEFAAALRAELDTTKVAIRGWSYGGFLSALAVLRRPDVFHAAVAGAPVTDHRLYDTHWRERHLGHPDDHPDAYDRSSLMADAHALTRPLLLIHGLADDNVVAAHTLRLSAALLAAGRPHEVLPLPAATHNVSDPALTENMLWHQLDFLRRALELPRRRPS
ncbi:MAG: prolyl oligopeptidase family serine peptidase [Streptosporangiaceae bacterium]